MRWWKNLSVSKKLYGVVGVMALLIATELFTLLFAMNILSAVRAFVQGEGLWSKAQKDAVYSLREYAISRNEKDYRHFLDYLEVPKGDHRARLELMKPGMDLDRVTEGFLAGRIHRDDIRPMVNLVRKFHDVSYLSRAIDKWVQGDVLMMKLIDLGDRLHWEVTRSKVSDPGRTQVFLEQIAALNKDLTRLEDGFSATLGEASRWMEHVLMLILILTVATVESTGLSLTISFTRGLTRALRELNEAADQVRIGNFNQTVPVRSRDELGKLAESLNRMTSSLNEQTTERHHAEQLSQTKSLFLANMSHEIRTPLNAILGFTELLRGENVSEDEKRSYLDIVKRTGASLTTIINDILDISKVEAERVEIEKSVFSLPQFFSDLELLLRMRCEEKGLSFSIQSQGECSPSIHSDPLRLRQILLNVVGNAIKFTERGGVSVGYEVIDSHLVFTVKDTGVGISSEQMGRLFLPFSQGDDSIRKKFGGTGLGLVLSKKLAQLLGGDIVLAESIPGKGSTFVIRIAYVPAASPSPEKPKPPENPQPLRNRRILVVEDKRENQLLVERYLEIGGAKADLANNGEEAIQKVSGERYDLILMDMQMPVMDGYAATQELRQKGCGIPIIALTGYAMKEDRDKCLQAGCNDYLVKPIDRTQLISSVAKYLVGKP